MVLGVRELEIELVTSGRTDDAFRTGKDDDVQLFDKKEPAEPKPEKEHSSTKMTSEQAKEALGKVPVMVAPGLVGAKK